MNFTVSKSYTLYIMTPFSEPLLYTKTPPPDSAVIKTVADLIDFNAEQNPDRIFCVQMTTQSPSGSLRAITNSLLRRMIVTCQEWILDTVREADPPFVNICRTTVKCKPVAIFMDSSLDLLVHLFALIGLGIPVGPSRSA